MNEKKNIQQVFVFVCVCDQCEQSDFFSIFFQKKKSSFIIRTPIDFKTHTQPQPPLSFIFWCPHIETKQKKIIHFPIIVNLYS